MKLNTYFLLIVLASQDAFAASTTTIPSPEEKNIEKEKNNVNKKHLRSLRMRNNAKESGFHCLNGCQLDTSEMVCAKGVTYQNACLAHCQFETDIEEGPCEEEEGNLSAKSFTTSFRIGGGHGGVVTHKVMRRFHNDGFNYIGKVVMMDRAEEIEEDVIPTYNNDENINLDALSGKEADDLSTLENHRLVRVTSTGDVYLSREGRLIPDTYVDIDEGPAVEEDDKSQVHSPTPPVPENGVEFSTESVIGADTRIRVTSSDRWTWWRVGKLSPLGCSGTIVGTNKVLTNAHCVWDRDTGSWYAQKTFSPGQNPSKPWGDWNIDYSTISTAYQGGGQYWHYDYAIATMKNDNWTGQDIGAYMGYLQLRSAQTYCHYVQSNTVKKRIVGYPSDKPSGTMWDSGQCEEWSFTDCTQAIIEHKCDTYPGNSGSGMLLFFYSSSWYPSVVGVHAFGTNNNGYNSGPSFSDSIVNWISTW